MSRQSTLALVSIIVLARLGPAAADDLDRCTNLSFAPLDDNVPACERVLAAEGLSDGERAVAHAARAEALQFALTYHGDREIDRDALLSAALADLDAAVALDPRYHGHRGSLRLMLNDPEGAGEDFTAAIRTDPANADAYLLSRSFALEDQGNLTDAIDDATAAARIAFSGPDHLRYLMRRAELHELAGDQAAAAGDYRRVEALRPGHPGAREGLARVAP